MNVTVITISIGMLGTIPKDLVKKLEEIEIRKWEETFPTTEKSPGDEEICCH